MPEEHDLRHRSKAFDGVMRAPNRAMLRATGYRMRILKNR